MDAESLRRRVDELAWHHSIDLGHGIVTPASRGMAERQRGVPFPDVRGKAVLDVGAWDGWFAFEAERRGAARVLATDSYCWSSAGPGTRAGFDLAREALGSAVEALEVDVMDLSPDRVGVFDVVLCLGVLYHMRDPLGALERVASVTGDVLVLETAVDQIHQRDPVLSFYPTDELEGDAGNWFAPNPAALLAMLRTVGLTGEVVAWTPRSWLGRCRRELVRRVPLPRRLAAPWRRDRVVVHASKLSIG